jgi:hypothetical protein
MAATAADYPFNAGDRTIRRMVLCPCFALGASSARCLTESPESQVALNRFVISELNDQYS